MRRRCSSSANSALALSSTQPAPVAAMAVILLRVLWTLAEVGMAAALYWWRKPAGSLVPAEVLDAAGPSGDREPAPVDVVPNP